MRASGWLRSEWLRRMRSRLALALLVPILVVLAFVALGSGPPVDQPMAFDHDKHTRTLELPCTFCHERVESGAHAGLPDMATCGPCHQEALTGTAEEAELLAAVREERPLVFRKLFHLPWHVYYTHARHVGIAGLDCTNCHGGIAQTTAAPRRPLVKISMDFCLECHRRSGASLDCVACHR